MWVQSYLTGRSQTVRLGSHCSGSIPCPVGVPQGSVLGPLLFTIYTSLISHIAESHNIKQHQYADDTQLFVALTSSNVLAQISTLESCLSSLQAGFVPTVCLWTQINPNISFLPPLRELSYYLIRSLLTSQACQFHSVTTSKYLVQCSILASLSPNTPRPSQNPVSIIFGPLNKFVVHSMTYHPNCFHCSCFFQAWLRKFYSVWYSI